MPAYIYFTIRDDKGDKSTIEIPFPDATAVTDLPLLVDAVGQLLDPLISGGLAGAGFRVEATVTGFPSAAGALSDIQEKAEFAFRTVTNFVKRLNIPSFIETFFLPGTREVDTTDADIAAFVTALEDGVDVSGAGGSGIVQPCDIRGDDLDTLEYAIENWGKRRK